MAAEEKWFLEFNYVNMGKPATVYFDINYNVIHYTLSQVTVKPSIETRILENFSFKPDISSFQLFRHLYI
jgi:hypothetical protein